MSDRDSRRYFLLFLDLVVLALCVFGVKHSIEKAWIGVPVRATEDSRGEVAFVVDTRGVDVGSPLRTGDTLVAFESFPLRYQSDLEQILDQYPTGYGIRVELRRDGASIEQRVALSHFYSTMDIVLQTATIAAFFLLGLGVYWRQPRDPSSRQFHALAIFVACVLAFSTGRFTIEPYGIGFFLRALLPMSNAFTGSTLLHFAFIFPTTRQLPRPAMLLLHLPPMVVSLWGAVASVHATVPFDLSAAPAFYLAVSTGKAMLGIGAVASVVVFFVNFLRSRDSAHRRQIAWAMAGASLSTAAFLLWQLSTSANVQRILPGGFTGLFRGLHMTEAMLNGALLVTAVSFAIGIVRYRMFNIELLLKRGTVYAIVLLIMILVNAAILSLGIRLIGGLSEATYMLLMTALTVDLLLIIPIRDMVQRGVNRIFFRVDYDFRESLRGISDAVLRSVQAEDAAAIVVEGLDRLLQLEGAMVMVVRNEGRLQVLANRGFERWKYPALHVRRERLQALPPTPVAFGRLIEPGAGVTYADMHFAQRYRVSLLFPLRTEDGTVIGLLILGHRKSGARFTLEDVDLVRAVGVQAGLQFERLQLQQRLLVQRDEAERLRELSRMKSFFVSGVSHDLKTPLTAISMFAELLEDQLQDQGAEARRSLGIIQGECGRLARLIDNVLDFTRIERGVIEYRLAPADLNDLARQTCDTMAYQLRIGGFVCRLELAAEPLPISADADALLQAVANLLGNAMKYSGESRSVILRTEREGTRAVLSVQDFGIGIRQEDIPQLFEPFFRSRVDQVQKLGGVGLGLSLVRHIAEAHDARVHVESAPGRGSTFRLSFALQEEP